MVENPKSETLTLFWSSSSIFSGCKYVLIEACDERERERNRVRVGGDRREEYINERTRLRGL